jgi:hypothetical protein
MDVRLMLFAELMAGNGVVMDGLAGFFSVSLLLDEVVDLRLRFFFVVGVDSISEM